LDKNPIPDLTSLDQKISSTLSYRLSVIKELKRLRQRKRELKNEITGLTDKIREERAAVDQYVIQSKELKETRSKILERIRKINLKVKEVGETVKRFEAAVPEASGEQVAEKLRRIEWKLQTERLTRDEEKQLVKYVKELELKLHFWKKAYVARQELTTFLVEMKALKDDLDQIAAFREKIQPDMEAKRERISNMVKARRQLFEEMDQLNQDITELEASLEKVDAELNSLRGEKKRMVDDSRRREMERILAKEKQLLEKAREAAKDKLAKGAKLTLDEFKLAFSDDKSELLK